METLWFSLFVSHRPLNAQEIKPFPQRGGHSVKRAHSHRRARSAENVPFCQHGALARSGGLGSAVRLALLWV
jgi:hypothetical protein